MDVKEVQGRPVVTIATGEKIGEVDDVVVDGQDRRVAAFRVSSGGFLSRQHHYLPFGAIKTIGDDAVMIQTADALQQSYGDRADGYFTLGTLTKLRVVTQSGTYIGDIASARFDPATGQITDFEVGTGGIFRSNTIVGPDSVISIGSDIIVVADTTTAAS